MTGPLTLGTAGHIDHGKTTLITALTGTDTDRLPEERQRGISIELGYARLELPSGAALSIIDVPGHERYVRTMVAGATGIDLYLMVVAADDGVMPQTREHAAVLKALAVERGVVAITKTDFADPSLARRQVSELLPGAAVVCVSARTGAGLDELRAALDRVAAGTPSRGSGSHGDAARLHIDRAFSVRGAGTVVTGTLWSGDVGRGDRVRLHPGDRPARVREVQVHDRSIERAQAGQRVAVNLTGVSHDEVARGDVLVGSSGEFQETFLIDCELEFASGVIEPESGTRVQVHHGTRETPARMAWLGGRFWQLRLGRPLIPVAGDRLVVRQIAPADTLGGGRVLDAHPRKHGPGRDLLARLERLSRGEPELAPEVAATPPPQLEEPAVPLSASALELEARLRSAGFEPPADGELDGDDLTALREAGLAVRVARNLHYHPDTVTEGSRRVRALAERHGGAVTIGLVRDELGTSRRFAQALLEHLDSERVTVRRGDQHFLRGHASGGRSG
jgi:selenocysteine-specific elongation factor